MIHGMHSRPGIEHHRPEGHHGPQRFDRGHENRSIFNHHNNHQRPEHHNKIGGRLAKLMGFGNANHRHEHMSLGAHIQNSGGIKNFFAGIIGRRR